jgi:hypothetical protein
VRSSSIVIHAPRFDLGSRVIERHELHDVQAFVSQPAVERYMDSPLMRARFRSISQASSVAAIYPALSWACAIAARALMGSARSC